MTTIPIFFTIDDKFAPYVDCAIRSIMENASPDRRYKFIVLHENVTPEHIEMISAPVEPPFEIEFIAMEEGFKGIADRSENRLRCDFFTMTIYFRIFIAGMFPQYDKGIYIDSDIIVPGDISEMFDIDLGDAIIAACPDYSIQGATELVTYVEQVVGIPRLEYVNSGVLLMDLKKMRDLHFDEHFLTLMNTYHFDSIAPDQDYINAMCRGKILFLVECWDTMPPLEGSIEGKPEPKLIHYNLFQKPWCYDDIPYEDVFWGYARKSPFYQDILENKANYSEEQKQSDQDCLGAMLTNGMAIIKNDVTMRKMFESGVKVRVW